MRKCFYRKSDQQIIIYDTLEVIDLNDTATYIFETLQETSIDQTINSYRHKYNLNHLDAKNDVHNLIEDFQQMNIKIKAENINNGKKIHTPIVHIIENCNSRCRMCDCWKTKSSNYLSAKDLLIFHKKMKQIGAQGIMISGGEPLLHPEIKTILSDLKKIQLPIFLNTNGILLDKHLDFLTQVNLDELVISIDASDSKTYSYIRGVSQFEKVWNNIRKFRSKNPDTRIVIRTTLMKQNLLQLETIIKMALDADVDHIGFSPLDDSSFSFSRKSMSAQTGQILREELIPQTQEIDKFLMSFIPGNPLFEHFNQLEKNGFLAWDTNKLISCLQFYKNVILNHSMHFNPSPCLFPNFSMVVDYNGDIKSCFYSKPFGHISNLQDLNWKSNQRIMELIQSKICSTCRGKIFCDSASLLENK